MRLLGSVLFVSVLLLGCGARQPCDSCEVDADCAEISPRPTEGHSCVANRCCANPGGRCTVEQVALACGAD